MSSNFWYLDRDHTQRGPVGDDEFVRLIRQGTITRETLMWTAGMSEWRIGRSGSSVVLAVRRGDVGGRRAARLSSPLRGHLRTDRPRAFRTAPERLVRCGVSSGAPWSRSSALPWSSLRRG